MFGKLDVRRKSVVSLALSWDNRKIVVRCSVNWAPSQVAHKPSRRSVNSPTITVGEFTIHAGELTANQLASRPAGPKLLACRLTLIPKPWPQNRYQSFILKIETETETGFWRPERRRPQYWSPVQSGLESISSGGPTPESRRSATLLSKLALNKNIISPHRRT